MKVPFVDIQTQYRNIKDEINAAVLQGMERGDFILGKSVGEFEKEFAAFCGVTCAAGVASGLDALHLALRALGIGSGDEVIVPTNTFIATALAVTHAGARPVLTDHDPRNYTITIREIEKKYTNKTKAIIPVHLYGQMADMDPIVEFARKKKIHVIEDACQAHGALYKGKKAGSFGILGCFSFYPGKNLGAYGDGGMLVSNDEALVGRLKMLRNYGSEIKYYHDVVGYNSRLDTLQAAILRVKMNHLESWTEKRRAAAKLYRESLAGVDCVLPVEESYARHVYHLFVIRVERRDELITYLQEKGVAAVIHYPIPIHCQKAYAHLGYAPGAFPVAEAYAAQLLSLPMFPEITSEQIRYVADCIKDFYRK